MSNKQQCPNCNDPLYWQEIKGPDGKKHRLVRHYGYHCCNCNADYQLSDTKLIKTSIIWGQEI